MLRRSLPLIGLLAASRALAELPESCAAPGGACEDGADETAVASRAGALLQKQSRAKSLSVSEEGSAAAGPSGPAGGVVEFTIGEEEFEASYEVIPKKMKAAGVNMKLYDPHFLTFTTQSGRKLMGRPKPSDFPLKFTYKQGTPAEEAAEGALAQSNASRGAWRNAAAQTPDSKAYTATQEDLDLADLAEHVYTVNDSSGDSHGPALPSGWTVMDHVVIPSKSFFGHSEGVSDRVALYSKGDTCVLAISGSDGNDIGDWLNNFNAIFTRDWCGRNEYHKGFVDELEHILSRSDFQQKILSKAADCSRRGRLIITGHSLGGAVATNLAECINSRAWWWQKPHALQHFPRKEVWLYTFGDPGTRRGVAATNDKAWGGAFKGKRFFSYDAPFCQARHCWPWCCDLSSNWALQDPVPWATLVLGFWHARIDAVGLEPSGTKSEFWKAGNADSPLEPDTLCVHLDLTNAEQIEGLVGEHNIEQTYKPRLKTLMR